MEIDKSTDAEHFIKDLNFKVDPNFHRAFKFAAARTGLSMKDILADAFEIWLAHAVDGSTRQDVYRIYLGSE